MNKSVKSKWATRAALFIMAVLAIFVFLASIALSLLFGALVATAIASTDYAHYETTAYIASILVLGFFWSVVWASIYLEKQDI